MLTPVLRRAILMATLPLGYLAVAGAQVAPTKEGSMLTPPPVSVDVYRNETASEKRLNFLQLGMTFSAGYIDNLYAGTGAAVLGEKFFSVRPTIAFDSSSFRQKISLLYTPGYSFYRPTSSLSETDQSLLFNYRLRPTPHGLIDVNDLFQQGAGSFNPGSTSGAGSGSGGTVIIAPFAKQLTNTTNGQYSLQLSPNSMIGVNGRLFELHYPDPTQVPGLYDSHERGGGGFYNLRVNRTQYVGASYKYSKILVNPQDAHSDIQTNDIYIYYSIYPKPQLSLSVAAGPQNYSSQVTFSSTSSTTGAPSNSSGWSPGITASMHWQGDHTNFAAGYSRTYSAGNGLLGTYHANGGSVTARWRALQTWTFGAGANYSDVKSVAPLPHFSATPGGHSISGMVSVDHQLNQYFRIMFQYDRLHQSYADIPVVAANPDSNREVLSLYWHFDRPLGR